MHELPHGRLAASALGRLAGAILCVVLSLVCLRLGWWVLFEAKVGPVVGTLDSSHGVHVGDAFGIGYVAVGMAAAAGALVLWTEARRTTALLLQAS